MFGMWKEGREIWWAFQH